MNKGFLRGFIAGLLCCVMLLVIVSCSGHEDESRLTKKESTPTPTQAEQPGTPTATLTPAKAFTDVEYQDKLNMIADVLDKYYYQDIDYNDVVDGLYHGMVNALGDPYSVYYNAEEMAAFEESSTGSYAGLGCLVTLGDDKYPKITRVFPGSPAEKAGLMAEDEVVEVDGEDLYGVDLSLVVTKVRGPIGSHVILTVYRAGEPEYLHIDVTRGTVEIPTIEYQMLEGNIGYISVLEFDEVTAQQFNDAVDDLQRQHMNALVVDLRNNPGGMLYTVKSMLSRILEKGKLLVYMEDKYGKREEHYSNTNETVDIPIAVLMNGNSASASEVFGGCLQDYGKAILVGTQSYGKGIVQTIIPLGDGSGVKVTISSYFTPNGRNIHKIGLTPDVEVELDDELKKLSKIPIEQDNQLKVAVEELQKKLGQ